MLYAAFSRYRLGHYDVRYLVSERQQITHDNNTWVGPLWRTAIENVVAVTPKAGSRLGGWLIGRSLLYFYLTVE